MCASAIAGAPTTTDVGGAQGAGAQAAAVAWRSSLAMQMAGTMTVMAVMAMVEG